MAKKKVKKRTKDEKGLVDISKIDILKPLSVEDIGTNGDPCFGKAYDLTTKECKLCGDSELCAIVFAQGLNKTRDQLEKENRYKDLDVLIDIEAVKKYMRAKKRAGSIKKDIIDKSMAKFEISRQDARDIYRTLKS